MAYIQRTVDNRIIKEMNSFIELSVLYDILDKVDTNGQVRIKSNTSTLVSLFL